MDNRFDKALDEAIAVDKRLDDLRNNRPIDSSQDAIPLPTTLKDLKEKFPLLGLPFTCKENFKAEGSFNY